MAKIKNNMAAFIKKQTEDKKNQGGASSGSMKDLYTSEKAVKSTKQGGAVSRKSYNEAYRVLIKPLVTEKASLLGQQNKYVFMADDQANKIMITRAIEHVYGIKPVEVNMIKIKGKRVRGRHGFGKRKNWKKALVTLPKGKAINVYEGV